ncbi:GtrA family protein [Ewingella americana]|uniref:GtrA family protein n=1 Tax=Ewingella americana TaxID=41202 RepID=A0A502GLI9_9GAMM|nr:GtrA family protein [Ewingella americana]TPG62734.1 GtrA family protein [Ewingella americana]
MQWQNATNSILRIFRLNTFLRYASVGVVNTLIHWVTFFVLIFIGVTSQALCNFAAFSLAVSFSFFANARLTFKAQTTTLRYLLYVGFMGMLSYAVGWASDSYRIQPIFTLIVFSVISLVCGFFYSKFIVFRSHKA